MTTTPHPDIKPEQVLEVARGEVRDIFELLPDERVVILSDTRGHDDEERLRIAEALHIAANEVTEARLLRFPPLERSGLDPPQSAIDAMLEADVILVVTSRSLTHSAAMVRAIRNGARAGTHTNRVDSYVRAVRDPLIMQERGDQLIETLNAEPDSVVHLTSDAGTNLTIPLGNRKFRNMAGYGLVRRDPAATHGAVDNIPGGEVCIAPMEGQAHGVMHIDLLLPSWAAPSPASRPACQSSSPASCQHQHTVSGSRAQ